MCNDIYQSPAPLFFFILCTLRSTGGKAPRAPLISTPVTVVQPGFVNGGGGGGKAREQSDRAGGGVSPSHGKENFENSCMKTAFLAH